MALPIEDYALIGDTETAALVGRDGSIDWLCLPRFDSPACFAALLGSPENGRWLLAPTKSNRPATRRYRGDTLVLETEFDAPGGAVRVIDFMPPRDQRGNIVRIVEGVRGQVEMQCELVLRFDYGKVVPWVRRLDQHRRHAVAGPDAAVFFAPVPLHGENMRTVGTFTVGEGERLAFHLVHHPSNEDPPEVGDGADELDSTEKFWRDWSGACSDWCSTDPAVTRSLLTLKALTYAPTGGIVAAPTTSLPECIGGVRNWDYRFCWLRDASFTLYALHLGGFDDEALAWRDWLLRAAAGSPEDLQIMYGAAGERRLIEYELPWLAGYENSAPVRVGNAATEQRQLDVYGEVMDSLHLSRRHAGEQNAAAWDLQRVLLEFLETVWAEPDEGIWEVRGPRRDFTHSKVMAWVAFDRAIKDATTLGFDGPVDRWTAVRDQIHREVLARGFDTESNSFVQYYGGDRADASLLMLPLVGFLPATDERMRGTVARIERELMADGFVKRYAHDDDTEDVDGLPPGEGAFLPCTFWLADNYALLGRRDEARATYERLLDLRNDVGLLSEEYDPGLGRMVGNFPQAFSHVGLVNTAHNLNRHS